MSDVQESHCFGSNTDGLEEGGEEEALAWYVTNLSDIIIVENDMDFHDMLEAFFWKGGDCRHCKVINDKNGDGFMMVDFMDKLGLIEIVAEANKLREWLEL